MTALSPLVIATVLVAGSLGAVIRYLLSRRFPVRPGHLPGGILIVNVVGSAVAGVVLGLAERAAVSADWRLILVTGFCGGLTTFSTWSVETIELLDGGRWRAALLNVFVTLVLGFAAAGAGYLLAR
ncbi:fluoride efflux transporter CrcB [Agromyces mediolanus]|uniref:Fluoride-specific ion channel FluC n=1 Tax=Agromyces mediolanus TaxID=41986 RepID=A0A918C942_AGRME|nr:fluoride efflux transporter CrcB [Agromyces mediolanus]GGR12038.1 putative fluoride ion transporter CrcB [Agromyces mediolanus]GLJ73307.1 putative fluoride ion transporter CrcB [Agromyces mediolanus]